VGDADKRTLVSANTVFDIAQMKNAFTAVAVMQLVEAGKLRLDADLKRLLVNGRDYAPLEALVAKASGQTYEQFVRKNQFERLGLRHTFFGSDLPASPGGRGFLRDATLIDPTEPAKGSVGGVNDSAIYATASDISFWDIGLAGEILIKDPALRKILYEGQVTSGAWNFPGHPGLMIATGSANGFSSLLSRFTNPQELICVTLLANREGLDLTQLARRIAGAHNPKTGPPLDAAGMRVQQSPYPLSETQARIDRLLGAGAARVWEEDGAVWVAVRDDPKKRKAIDEALLRAVSAD
jgi:CubicO group peptidase (beta-lactamase class C family)